MSEPASHTVRKALEGARRFVREELDHHVDCTCPERDDGTPIMGKMDSDTVPRYRHVKRLLGKIDAALAGFE